VIINLSYIVVTAAILLDRDKILIARRRKGKHLEFKWEFPGGKVNRDETEEEALKRELKEEFSIDTLVKNFVAESFYEYDHISINLRAYLTKIEAGEIQLTDHDEVAWVNLNELNSFDFAPADLPIVKSILSDGIRIN